MISQDTIDRVRERARISEVIGKSVRLERRGRSLLGLCPFHKEKSPSFHVHDDRGFYHCFGCGASGDVFKFVMETEGLSFQEAISQLAERVGVVVDLDLSDDEQKQRSARKRREEELYRMNEAAAAYFERMLEQHPDARHAHDELAARGLDYAGPEREVLRSFRLGYAPSGWDGFAAEVARLGLRPQNAEVLGLIAPRAKGSGYYDRFRHRLMFAVTDIQGRVIAFSGRVLRGAEASQETKAGASPPPKYVNSPETPIYRKREAVFGLYQSRKALRDGQACVIVEGNFDVVSLHARGVPRAVAPLGTAFTVEQARLIRRFTHEGVFLFDADAAGQSAVKKARGACLEADLRVKVGTLPKGKDPDEFSRAQGQAGVELVLSRARGMLDYLIHESLEAFTAGDDLRALAQKIGEIGELIGAEADPTLRALAEQQAAEMAGRLGVTDPGRFREILRGLRRSASSPTRAPAHPAPAHPAPAHPAPAQLAPARPAPAQLARAPATSRAAEPEARGRVAGRVEERVLGALLDFPELLESAELQAMSSVLEGDIALCVAVLKRTLEKQGKQPNFHEAPAKIPEPLRPFASARLAAPLHEELTVAKSELVGNLRKLLAQEHARMAAVTTKEIERARFEGDLDQELELLRDLERRARMRQGI